MKPKFRNPRWSQTEDIFLLDFVAEETGDFYSDPEKFDSEIVEAAKAHISETSSFDLNRKCEVGVAKNTLTVGNMNVQGTVVCDGKAGQ